MKNQKKYMVAVYGTLKRGFHNNRCLEGADFVATGKTSEQYPLVVDGLPYLFDKPGEGHQVKVEVFAIDDPILERLDRLEGHPGFYCRKKTKVVLSNKTEITAWVYFLVRKNYAVNGKMLEEYTGKERLEHA